MWFLDWRKLEQIQKVVTRIIRGLKYMPSCERPEELNLLCFSKDNRGVN